jgi:surface protein
MRILFLLLPLLALSQFKPANRAELKTAVNLWVSNETSALDQYGEINTWDTSNVTDMSELFKDKTTFNGDISSWDTSNVTNMRGMFWDATAFNQDIGSWVTTNVTDMSAMFWDATAFNQDIGSWDTSYVRYMRYMFDGATSFNQNLINWSFRLIVPESSDSFYFEPSGLNYFINNCPFSRDNFDNLLIAFATNSSIQDVVIGAQNLKYCGSADYFNSLIGVGSWTFEGEPINDCEGYVDTGDINKDGVVNSIDLIHLASFLVGVEGYEMVN